MHELSLMEGIIGIVEKAAADNKLTKIKTIRIVLGELTSAYPEALQAAFEAWADDPLFSDALLDIERIPISAHCRMCDHRFYPAAVRFECPICFSTDVEMGQGQEFYVDYIDGV